MDDLTTLGVSASDRKKLEIMGFTTLEQIALMDRWKLGMGKQKGDTLITRARNILANKNIESIDIREQSISVLVKTMNDAVLTSIKDVLSIYEDYLLVQCEGNKIQVSPKKIGKPTGEIDEWKEREIKEEMRRTNSVFRRVKEESKKWLTIAEAKKRDILAREGIEMEREKIIDFAKARGFDGFWKNVFSEIKGNEVMKKALSVAIFSSYEEPVHVIVMGEPGTCKTLAKEIITRSFKDVSVVGGNTTRAGLVCSLATGQPGILASSDRRLVLIDEFDKIPKGDVEYCYELLSNGKCTIHSARVHQDIESKFISIAFANPQTEVFTEKPIEDIGLPRTLLSRFALIIRPEDLTEGEEMDLLRKKFRGEAEIRKMPEYYDQWIKLARLHKPEITASEGRVEDYLKRVKEIIGKHRITPLRRDYRMGDYSRWIPMAIARAEFSNVTDEVIDKAEELLTASIQIWS